VTATEDPIKLLHNARNLLAGAAACWNAGDPAAIDRCVAALDQSASELRAAEAVAIVDPKSLTGFGSEILQIRDQVAGIERLLDLASSFLRGGGWSSGDSLLYRVDGLEDTDSSLRATAMAATRIQA
jgi:HEAT repeat protein